MTKNENFFGFFVKSWKNFSEIFLVKKFFAEFSDGGFQSVLYPDAAQKCERNQLEITPTHCVVHLKRGRGVGAKWIDQPQHDPADQSAKK